MADLDKVIKGLECCTHDIPLSNNVHKTDFCKECPYYNPEYSYCFSQETLMRDALALLKEQEAEIRQLKLALDIAKGTCKGIAFETDEKFMGDL